jgi:hypothetical protein
MAYVVPRALHTYELRESRSTPHGPRSRTLASFSELTPEVVRRAQVRASAPLAFEAIRKAALRVGAPVAPAAPDRAAAELLAELAAGRRPRPALEALLRDTLGGAPKSDSSNAQAAAAWIPASPHARGEALVDLLLLADRLPAPRRSASLNAPRLQSSPR